MGASLSNLTEGANGAAMGPGLGDIPESCVACVFTYLTPPEICNLARLNTAFRGAASSDSVWEKKLPPNYQDLLDLLPPERYQNLSKKDIFALLSRPIPLTMAIRFNVVAYLQQIWWFEVDGVVKFPFPADIYTLSFRLHLGRFAKRLGRRVCSFEHTHGWGIKPVRFELSTSNGQQASSESCLDEAEQEANGNHKRGLWLEYKVGEFVVTDSEPFTEVQFSMKQIDCTHSKGGLCVDSVFIIPSDLKQRKRREVLK
ncbi:hypothetical protein GH714_038684 [Hevea brasiliensis]|uniref:F-box domain-containing protein n=1 Tax=Hevea brasiliensis TaxID=3981 RepID=A0A6A6KLF0_HEVBR|nr:hypothetical protein GH714_038684 [Hevea brasiliensis]